MSGPMSPQASMACQDKAKSNDAPFDASNDSLAGQM